jgi:hypothetical protein
MTTTVPAAMLAADVPTEAEVATKLVGDLIQRGRVATAAASSGTTVVPSASIPAITDGNLAMSLSFTPLSATSILRIRCLVTMSHSVASALGCAALHAGGAAIAVGGVVAPAAADMRQVLIEHEMVAGTTSAIPFTVRYGYTAAGTATFNGTAATQRFGGVLLSSITVDEIKA